MDDFSHDSRGFRNAEHCDYKKSFYRRYNESVVSRKVIFLITNRRVIAHENPRETRELATAVTILFLDFTIFELLRIVWRAFFL